MNRRNLAQVVAGTAVAHGLVTVMGCQAQQKAAEPHAGHDHGEKKDAKPAPSPVSGDLKTLSKKTAECVLAGETCLEHCIRSLSSGSTMMADCAKQVQQMLPLCRAMSSLSAMGSEYSKELSTLCKKACEACAAECKKHAGHHEECAACAKACEETVAAVAALV